jgi:hypothetical protein
MDKNTERANKERILALVGKRVRTINFTRTRRTTFYTREKPIWIEFVHLHKFTFGPEFRAHLGIRILNDPTPHVALNGPAFAPNAGSQYCFSYDQGPESLEKCAVGISEWLRELGQPWFLKWQQPRDLLEAEDSPLSDTAKAGLRDALANKIHSIFVGISRDVLL